jgi:hypothetical protein
MLNIKKHLDMSKKVRIFASQLRKRSLRLEVRTAHSASADIVSVTNSDQRHFSLLRPNTPRYCYLAIMIQKSIWFFF